ncbi:hypothetical protein MBSD_n0384 [Mizugakiibacter sediminis]|uniref:site-specific DNA-methyltransferase (adenine-specific) n=1 Tax=Mizugakiibacter sediminis TaxID=1475481 RepID=A0A0K8QJI4_9GAMM|nr:site-specific DNA-methyltransferase [Mizugakiibacter sediminis]GAP65095.1 hypothetical protein MBSD_n0384 [Mizugakiibacter sediminis]
MPELNWLGDAKARKAAARVPYRLLEPVAQIGDPAAENLLVQGDNLDALKSLLPLYAGRVKCVFIDPPYNTKSAFEHYDDNLEHSQWLSMMYPRLVLLRDLLAEDGSIWVTIDDNEAHYLKVLMDEVFGRRNFIGNVVWQKKYTISNDATLISDTHDHVLIFAKAKEHASFNLLPRTERMNARFRNPDNHPKGPWKATPLHARSGTSRESYRFRNGVVWEPPVGTFRRYSDATMAKLEDDNAIWFGRDGRATPARKTFLSELTRSGTVPSTVWLHDDVGSNHEARDEVRRLNPNDPFTSPKPERLLHRIIHIATNPGDLVLDSFLGSGTTAAVAHKMGRRWIGIEMGEHARTHCLPRLTKVVEGEQGGISQAVGWQGGGGFRFARLGEPVFDADGRINPAVRFAPLAAYLWFAETREPHASGMFDSPLLGVHGDTAIALLYNGILGDRRPQGGNVLTRAVWDGLRALRPDHAGPWIVYGEACRLAPATLKRCGIAFKQIPYDIRVR